MGWGGGTKQADTHWTPYRQEIMGRLALTGVGWDGQLKESRWQVCRGPGRNRGMSGGN